MRSYAWQKREKEMRAIWNGICEGKSRSNKKSASSHVKTFRTEYVNHRKSKIIKKRIKRQEIKNTIEASKSCLPARNLMRSSRKRKARRKKKRNSKEALPKRRHQLAFSAPKEPKAEAEKKKNREPSPYPTSYPPHSKPKKGPPRPSLPILSFSEN